MPNFMKYFLFGCLLLFTAALSAQTENQKHRLVMQLSSNDTIVWRFLMSNLKSLQAGWNAQVQVEVVAFGPGVDLLTAAKSTQKEKLAEFAKKGVVFVACENSMRLKNITKTDLVPEAGTVPMGIGEIVLKQEQ